MEELFLNIDIRKQIIFMQVSENYTICFLDLDVCCHCMCVLGNCGLILVVQFILWFLLSHLLYTVICGLCTDYVMHYIEYLLLYKALLHMICTLSAL